MSLSTKGKKESILELAKFADAKVRVKCIGGRELIGILKGYDELVNLVLDDCEEFLRGKETRLVTLIWHGRAKVYFDRFLSVYDALLVTRQLLASFKIVIFHRHSWNYGSNKKAGPRRCSWPASESRVTRRRDGGNSQPFF